MRIHLICAALLLASAPAARAQDNPLIMATGAHLAAVCGQPENATYRLYCLSWLNGASQGNGWFEPREAGALPAWCPPSRTMDLKRHREQLLAWIKANKLAPSMTALEVHARALAAIYPCKAR